MTSQDSMKMNELLLFKLMELTEKRLKTTRSA